MTNMKDLNSNSMKRENDGKTVCRKNMNAWTKCVKEKRKLLKIRSNYCRIKLNVNKKKRRRKVMTNVRNLSGEETMN